MTKDDGGAAFPSSGILGTNGRWFKMTEGANGMTLRDYFAAAAMQGIVVGVAIAGDNMGPNEMVAAGPVARDAPSAGTYSIQAIMDAFHTTVEEFASEGSSASRDGDQIASASVGTLFHGNQGPLKHLLGSNGGSPCPIIQTKSPLAITKPWRSP